MGVNNPQIKQALRTRSVLGECWESHAVFYDDVYVAEDGRKPDIRPILL